jgi:hypothetical protein
LVPPYGASRKGIAERTERFLSGEDPAARGYAAFVHDLHGNNIEAVFHSPEAITDAPMRTFVP